MSGSILTTYGGAQRLIPLQRIYHCQDVTGDGEPRTAIAYESAPGICERVAVRVSFGCVRHAIDEAGRTGGVVAITDGPPLANSTRPTRRGWGNR